MGEVSEDIAMLKGEEETKCIGLSPTAPSVFEHTSNPENQDLVNEDSTSIFGGPSANKATWWDIAWLMISIVLQVSDVGLDINAAVGYYVEGKRQYFTWTVAFIVVPSLATTLISGRWYFVDYVNNPDKKLPLRTWVIRCLSFLILLAPTLRYAETLHFAFKFRRYRKRNEKAKARKYYYLMLTEDSDAALLRVFECFLESAPQLVLQLSILMYTKPMDYSWLENLQKSITLMSFVSLAWTIASYHRSLRYHQPNKNNITTIGMVFQFLWHLMITASRVVALSCLASKFPLWVIICCSIHIITFFVYLLFNGPEDGSEDSIFWQQILCLFLAGVYIFTGIHTRDNNTRRFYSFLYSVYFLENIVLVVVWFYFVTNKVHMFLLYLIPIASISFFISGIGFMTLYHLFFHPKLLSGRGTP